MKNRINSIIWFIKNRLYVLLTYWCGRWRHIHYQIRSVTHSRKELISNVHMGRRGSIHGSGRSLVWQIDPGLVLDHRRGLRCGAYPVRGQVMLGYIVEGMNLCSGRKYAGRRRTRRRRWRWEIFVLLVGTARRGRRQHSLLLLGQLSLKKMNYFTRISKFADNNFSYFTYKQGRN